MRWWGATGAASAVACAALALLAACGVRFGAGASDVETRDEPASQGTDGGGSAATRADTLNVQILSNQVPGQDGNLSAGQGSVAVADPMPPVGAALTGQVVGNTVPAQDVVFEYAPDPSNGGKMAMVLFFGDQANMCSRHTQSPVPALPVGARSLRIALISLAPGSDQPFIGTFQIYNPTAGAPPSRTNVAAATFVVADGKCGNQLPADSAWATAGQVTITTHVTAGGVYLSGQLSGLLFGNQQDKVDGSFIGHGCSTNWAPTDIRQTCR